MAITQVLEAFESDGSYDCQNGYTVVWMMSDVVEGKGNLYDVAVYQTDEYSQKKEEAQLLAEGSNLMAGQVNELIDKYSKKEFIFFADGRIWTYGGVGEEFKSLIKWRSTIGQVFVNKDCDYVTIQRSIYDYSNGYWKGQHDAQSKVTDAKLSELKTLLGEDKAVSA